MEKTPVWKFPPVVDISLVSLYMSVFERLSDRGRIIFDMRDIEEIHSSFIGFLVFCKERSETGGGRLVLEFSPYLSRTLAFLGMADYFAA